MSRRGPGIAVALAMWLAAAGLALAASDPGQRSRGPREPPRQILVMLRLPPAHLRPNTDYDDLYGDKMGRSVRRQVAGRLAREFGLKLADEWPMPLVSVDCFIMSLPAGRSPE